MPRARAKKGPEEAAGPSKAWLDSYADAMTLLLAFFILLYASSILDEDRFIDFKIGVAAALGQPSPALDGGLGILSTGNGVTSLIAAAPMVQDDGSREGITKSELDDVNEATRENAEEIVEQLEGLIEEVGAAPYVDVVDDPRGVILRFDSQVLFRSGESTVLPDGVLVLQSVAGVLTGLDNLLVVEGHTDDVPTTGSTWPTNWELSTSRATTVLRFLHEIQDVPAVRLSAAGYADTRPRDSNDTAEGRAENRRVEIVILIQPFLEELLPEGQDLDLPLASDFGAEVETPAAPEITSNNLLDPSAE